MLGIAASMLAMVAPSFLAMQDALELRLASYDLFTGLHLARSEAIKRNARVVICKSPDAERCSIAGGWEHGWIVFQDANNDALRQPEEDLISQHQTQRSRMHITGNGNVRNYVSFTATGNTRLISHAFQAGTVTVCPLESPDLAARQLVINSTGRMRMTKNPKVNCPMPSD